MISKQDIIAIHKMVDKKIPETYVPAAEKLIKMTGLTKAQIKKLPQIHPEIAIQILHGLYQSLLEEEKYIDAALLAWGPDIFNPEPEEVKRMFAAFAEDHRVLVMGAGGLGKTYSIVARVLMDWSRDPEFTNWKLVSTSESHARSNTWSTLCSMHAGSIIPFPGKPQTDFLGMSNTDRQAAIAIVKIPAGDDGKARLQGFHPKPRPEPHPKFGKMTRVGAFIDEAEKVPAGVWVGEDNMWTSATADGHVKIIAVTNPDDISSMFALKAEPETGWENFDPETDFGWISKKGYRVLRLDAKQSANVKKRRLIFPGMQTYEGFASLENQGPHSRAYWTFGRGAYPVANVEYNVVPSGHLKGAIGNFQWLTMPYNVASFDGAFADGGDDAIVTTGRYGMAMMNGKARPVLLVEQQFLLTKKNSLDMMDDLIKLLKVLHVRPEHFIMDKTGNGIVFHDGMKVKFGDIHGVQWASDATDKKILLEDTLKASDQYKNIISEMWFAMARWLEFGYIKFAPTMPTQDVFFEMTSRKYGKFYKVETKADYKKRTKRNSPDKADSLIMLVHLCRVLNAFDRPEMIQQIERRTADFQIGLRGADSGDVVTMIDFEKI